MEYPTIHISPDLNLRFLQLADAERLFLLMEENRSYLKEWLPWLDMNTRIEDSRNFINTSLMKYFSDGTLTFGMWYKGKLSGVIGTVRIDKDNQQTSIGYWVGERFQGNGIVSQSVYGLVDHLFRNVGIHRIEIRCATGNTRSRAIPERLGFQHEGTLREVEWLYHRFVDHEVYGLLRTEWERRKADYTIAKIDRNATN